MKLLCMLIFTFGCLIISLQSSPIEHEKQQQQPQQRQAIDQTPEIVPAAVAGNDDEDDDDDDDEDDILGDDILGEDDDDDDDDDEEEEGGADDDDDDDDDYLERFFDDIIGEDDDDDEDDASPSTGAVQQPIEQPVVQQQQPAVVQPISEVADANNVNYDEIEETPVLISETAESVVKPASVVTNEVSSVDEDDDDEDDDDDDDDDFIGDDVIEARGLSSANGPEIIEQYNRLVDGIFERINKVLKRSYDPVNVRLTSERSKTLANTKKNKRKTNKKTKKPRDINDAAVVENKSNTNNNNLKEKKQLPVQTRATTNKKPTAQKNKTKPTKLKVEEPKKSRANGSMYGLSTLQRTKNVQVTSKSAKTSVKSNFMLGPLTLKVSKTFKHGDKRELRSITATTTEMRGQIILELENGNARISSIKVQQPKQVQIETTGGKSDRTREFLWKQNYNIVNIAQAVASNLRTATETLSI